MTHFLDSIASTSLPASVHWRRCLEAMDWAVGGTHNSGSIYQSPEWWSCSETMAPNWTNYVCSCRDGESVEGILPVYVLPAKAAGLYNPLITLGTEVFQRLRQSAGSVDKHVLTQDDAASEIPVAILGGRAGYLTHWTMRDATSSRECLADLCLGADRVAASSDAEILTAQFLPSQVAHELIETEVFARDEFVLQAADARVDINTNSFDSFLTKIDSGRRSVIQRDLTVFRASKCQLTVQRLADSLSFAPQLLANVQLHHGENADLRLMTRMLETQARFLNEKSIVVVSRSESGLPVAYSLSYEHNNELYVRLVGIDYHAAQASRSYFVTAFYEPIRIACERGLERVHLGIGSLKTKILRGAYLEPLYAVFRGNSVRRISPDEATQVSLRNYRLIQEQIQQNSSLQRVSPHLR